MKRLVALLLTVALFVPPAPAVCETERNDILDTAFTLLEYFNPFVKRYEDLTGACVKPLFPLGVPYFYGGTSYNWMTQNYPDYYAQKAWNDSIYYRSGLTYFYGFDCAGFARWLMRTCRRLNIGTIEEAISFEAHQFGFHLYCNCSHPSAVPMPAWNELSQTLRIGDMLAGKHGKTNHIMVYIGTLRDYGYTAGEAPELAQWLDYPLVIHSSAHPAFGERFDLLIEEQPELYGMCTVPDGGVAISIIGVPWESAPNHSQYQLQDHAWFELENDCLLTLVDFSQYGKYCWYRR